MTAAQIDRSSRVFTGRDGVLRAAGEELAKVVNFSVQANLETLETTTLGDHTRTYSPGIVGYTGNATVLYYKEGNNKFNTTKVLSRIYKGKNEGGVTSRDTILLKFQVVDGNERKTISMNAYIVSASIGVATGDIVRAEIAFQGTGDLDSMTFGDTGLVS